MITILITTISIIIIIIIMEGEEDLVEEVEEIHLKMVTIITRGMMMKMMNGIIGLLAVL